MNKAVNFNLLYAAEIIRDFEIMYILVERFPGCGNFNISGNFKATA